MLTTILFLLDTGNLRILYILNVQNLNITKKYNLVKFLTKKNRESIKYSKFLKNNFCIKS